MQISSAGERLNSIAQQLIKQHHATITSITSASLFTLNKSQKESYASNRSHTIKLPKWCCAGQRYKKNHNWSFINAGAANLDLLESLWNYLQNSFRSLSQIPDGKLLKQQTCRTFQQKQWNAAFVITHKFLKKKLWNLTSN